MTEIAEITALLKSNKLTEALDLADRYLAAHPDDAEALFLRGKIHWRKGNRPRATSDYAAAAAADPRSPAAEALEQARAVEDFFNPDLLNP